MASEPMDYLYYPGCTMTEWARSFDASGRAAARALAIELHEMERWTCCGTTFPLTSRRMVGLLAPVRTLVRAQVAGRDQLLTLCTFCYNVLKRTNHAVRSDGLDLRRINTYLEDEFARAGEDFVPYNGEVEVVHLLEVLRDQVGWEALAGQTRQRLDGLRVAPYYGCLLLRPAAEIGLDDADEPTILEEMLAALGCEVVDFPHRVECCGSYLSLGFPDIALQNSWEIVHTASRLGADAVAVVCPLCSYNLDRRQTEMHDRFTGFHPVPVLYFTELLSLALDTADGTCDWQRHAVDPRPLLADRRLM